MSADELRDQTETWVGSEVAHWKQEARKAQAAIERVRAVHESEQYIDDAWPHCLECTKDNADVVPWPCPTLRALDGSS